MTTPTISHVLGSRFRVSKEADDLTAELHVALNLGSKGRLVRLALGRSLGMGPVQEKGDSPESDAKGQEVPARAIFKDEDVEVWLGLMTAHSVVYGGEPLASMDALRKHVRLHWTRGVRALQEDWLACDEDYEKFVHALVSRRAHLRSAAPAGSESIKEELSQPPADASETIAKALREIGVDAEVRGTAVHGPRTTRYRLYLRDVNQLSLLKRKMREIGLLLNIQAGSVSFDAGDEARVLFLSVPRPREQWNSVTQDAFQEWRERTRAAEKMLVFLGEDELGNSFEFDLGSAPHLFVAGTTGSGKSVCLHSIICSLISTQPAGRLQLALLDPKQVEFAQYERYASLYQGGIAYDPSASLNLLDELVVEMDARYATFRQRGVSSWSEADDRGFAPPRIVVIVEELADLLLARKSIEVPLTQLAQKARAAGIHLVLATQRPDAKTFSGLLRSNIPSRIALSVQKASESSIILDEHGAEDLLGSGDMFVKLNGEEKRRVHGVYLERSFVDGIVRNSK